MRATTRFVVTLLLSLLPLAMNGSNGMAQSETSSSPSSSTLLKPGQDRWPVKTATDDDADRINATPVVTTVEALLALPRPVDMPLHEANPKYQSHRARGAETSVYTVEALVTECRLMPDGDYRITIQGKSGKTLVLEMPNPDPKFVAPKGRFSKQIRTARNQFNVQSRPLVLLKPLTVSRRARITGIGFFGHTFRPDQPATGNLIQLHPVLNIKWLPITSAKPR